MNRDCVLALRLANADAPLETGGLRGELIQLPCALEDLDVSA